MDLTIIIPTYNEEKRLGRTLDAVRLFIEEQVMSYEVIIVDDGSRDGTVALVQNKQKVWSELRLISNKKNKGKGSAVKQGALAAQGNLVLFSDADLSTPIDEYINLKNHLSSFQIAIASRDLKDSQVEQHQIWYRELMGKVFNKIVRILTGLPFHDTQCGFKLFTREAVNMIFPKLTINRYAFDVEILWLAKKKKIAVSEVPVRWVNDAASRVNPIVDSSRMLSDIFKIHLNNLRRKYS